MGSYAHWFDTSSGMPRVSDGNVADFFIDGDSAFEDLGERLELDGGSGAALYLLGWSCDINTTVRATATPAGRTLGDHLAFFARKGSTVRAMLWKNTIMATAGCDVAVPFINALPGGMGRAILDHRTPLAGAHHQKVQILIPSAAAAQVTAGEAPPAVAYCGGMDVFPDRVGAGALHDVHCKLRGPAADDLVRVFQDRWNDHPDHTGSLTDRFSQAAYGKAMVQVCATYPTFQSALAYSLIVGQGMDSVVKAVQGKGVPSAGDMRVNGSVRFYNFYQAGVGVQQIARAVKKAIAEAKRFIYLEDQYLTSKWVGDALAAKLAATPDPAFRIVILALDPSLADIEQIWPRRRAVLAGLKAADPTRKRWTVVTRRLDRPHGYVHSKTWIVDDELVITGSANADRRGYTYNSEVDVVVAGDVTPGTGVSLTPGATTLAQELRARLFAKHLGGKATDHVRPGPSLARFFGDLRSTATVAFNPNSQVGNPDKYAAPALSASPALLNAVLLATGLTLEELLWDYLEDPDSAVVLP